MLMIRMKRSHFSLQDAMPMQRGGMEVKGPGWLLPLALTRCRGYTGRLPLVLPLASIVTMP